MHDDIIAQVPTRKERSAFLRSLSEREGDIPNRMSLPTDEEAEQLHKNNLALLDQFEKDIAHAIKLARGRLTQDPPIPMKACYRLESHTQQALEKLTGGWDSRYGAG